MSAKLTICLNLDGNQLSQWANYDFDCFVTIDDKSYGSKDDGVFELDAGALDHSENIYAFFELVTSDFGIPNDKRVRLYNAGYETDGTLRFIVTVDGYGEDKKTYLLTPSNVRNRQHGSKFYGNRDQRGRYWMFRVENVSGCDFSMDHIEIFPTILLR